MDKLLSRRPEYVTKKVGSTSKVCLLNSRDILDVLKDKKVIIMACNTRIRHAIPGIMKAAEELDAVVAFELAKTEGNVDGGYTGQDPETYFTTVVEYAEQTKFSKPFFIHGDHVTVRDTTDKEIESSRALIAAELKAGYTSFAIDASFNHLEDNIRIATALAQPIMEAGIGLEVEVGEIKSTGQEATLTTVEEAEAFVKGLWDNGIRPNLLAINNGSKHGNYLEGEKVFIDLERTGEVYEAISSYGMSIAQHGITGTPLHLIGRFADYGIRKGNVGTLWQNVCYEHFPQDLMDTLKKWAEEQGEDIKKSTRPFKKEIDSIPTENVEKIIRKAYEESVDIIKGFRAEGTASMVAEGLK